MSFRPSIFHFPLLVVLVMPLMACASGAFAAEADDVAWQQVQRTALSDDANVARWQKQLDAQVNKLVAAGHMAPWRWQPGETESYFYFSDPYELILTISQAMPHMSSDTRAAAAAYLKREIAAYPPGLVDLLPRDQGQYRENYPLSDEDRTFRYRRWLWRSAGNRPRMMVFYALWNYADATGDWETIESLYPQLVLLYERQINPKIGLLEEATGLLGFARVAVYMGDQPRADRALQLATLLIERQKDLASMQKMAEDRYDGNTNDQGGTKISRILVYPLLNLVPESARFLAEHHKDAVTAAISRLTARYPLWYVPLPPHSDPLFGEGLSMAPDLKPNIMLGRSMVLGESAESLEKDLDIPALPVGDLFYIQCLSAILNAKAEKTWSNWQPPQRPTPWTADDEAKIDALRIGLEKSAAAQWLISPAMPPDRADELANTISDQTSLPQIQWQPAAARNWSIDLKAETGSDASNVAAFAMRTIVSSDEQRIALSVKNDDPFTVWLNGRLIVRNDQGLGWMPGEQLIPLTLRSGNNDLVLRVDQKEGGWNFIARPCQTSSAPLPE